MANTVKILLAFTLSLMLVACGGGGSSENTPPSEVLNNAPVASAGADQNVVVGDEVTLDGGASSDADGNTLAFAWTLTSKPTGSIAKLADASSAKPTLAVDLAGTYVATLIVNDGKVYSAASSVTITATVGNALPVANAGIAQNVTTGALVTLNGSASSDANGDPLTYAWTLTSAPPRSAATLSSNTAVSPTFTADVAGTYMATLVVSDGNGLSNVSTVVVTAKARLVMGVAYIAPTNGLSVTLITAAGTDLGNGYVRYTATFKQTNLGESVVSDTFSFLWFSNGQKLSPGFFTTTTVLPGEAFSSYRSYQYDAPASWSPLFWEYGPDFFATTPGTNTLQWQFPLQ